MRLCSSDLTLLVGWQERYLACKNTEFLYSGSGDLTGVLHILECWFSPLSPPSSFAAVKSTELFAILLPACTSCSGMLVVIVSVCICMSVCLSDLAGHKPQMFPLAMSS